MAATMPSRYRTSPGLNSSFSTTGMLNLFDGNSPLVRQAAATLGAPPESEATSAKSSTKSDIHFIPPQSSTVSNLLSDLKKVDSNISSCVASYHICRNGCSLAYISNQSIVLANITTDDSNFWTMNDQTKKQEIAHHTDVRLTVYI
jgi:hypothetical protein